MKVRLLYPDRDLSVVQTLPPQAEDLCADLELEVVFSAMADGDPVIRQTVRQVLLQPLETETDIRWRQAILQDWLAQPQALRTLYQLLTETLAQCAAEHRWLDAALPSSRVYGARHLLEIGYTCLEALGQQARSLRTPCQSPGLRQLWQALCELLTPAYLQDYQALLKDLDTRDGTLMALTLDDRQRAAGYQLVHKNAKNFRLRWALTPGSSLPAQDDAGGRDLAARCDQASWGIAGPLCTAALGLEQFLDTLRRELAFWLGAVQLHRILAQQHIACCLPELSARPYCRRFDQLRDLSLALQVDRCVGNRLDSTDKTLYVITGANQGGKTTFLRSIGQAQVLLQGGLFVAAEAFCGPVCRGIFTHFSREEDAGLRSGRLEEELDRLDRMIPLLKPTSLLLCNESFSSTNEREGAAICGQITRALHGHGVELFHVTHLYSFAQSCREAAWPDALFLRAERLPDGSRSYCISPGAPEQTAHGEDLYREVFGQGETK